MNEVASSCDILCVCVCGGGEAFGFLCIFSENYDFPFFSVICDRSQNFSENFPKLALYEQLPC